MKPALKLKIIMGQAAEKSKYLAGIDQADAAQVAGLKNGPLTSSSASTAPELSDDEFADLLHWVQNGAAEDALTSFDEALLTPIQASGASLLDPLTPLGSDRRMLDYLEGIGRRYGAYGDQATVSTGIVPEIGGVIGLLDGQLVASRIFSGRETGYPNGGMNLAAIRIEMIRQHPGFVPLYDWHFHPTADLIIGGDTRYRTDFGFSPGDVNATRPTDLRGSYVVMPDRVLYMSTARANQIPRDTGYTPPRATRQWTPGTSPWPWRWPY